MIITTGANAVVAPIHHRMPVVRDVAAGHAWLADGEQTGCSRAPAIGSALGR